MAHIDHVAIAERAHEQLGLITRTQIADIGVSRRQVDRMIDQGLLRRAGRGVLALVAVPSTPRQRLLAATLGAGGGAVVSHRAAAWLWGFDGIMPAGIELSVERGRGATLADGMVHRVRRLDPVDVTRTGPIPVTTPARTLIDLASAVPRGPLEEALDGACRRGQVHVDHLTWRLRSLGQQGRAGASTLAALIEPSQRGRAESWLESALLRLLRESFLPMPRMQVTMRPGPGRAVRVDGIYDEQGLVVEVSGHATHATRRQRQSDAERRARLVAAGMRVVDFTYEDVVDRPHYVVDTITRLLGLEPSTHPVPTR